MSRNAKPKRRPRRPKKQSSQGRMWPWYAAAIVLVGGITIYDNRQQLGGWSSASHPVEVAKQEPRRKPDIRVRTQTPLETVALARPANVAKPSQILPSVPVPDDRPAETAAIPAVSDGKFFYCSPSRSDRCVIDGDTFVFKGEKIRIADIEAPKARQARCDAERLLAHDAKERLRILLSAGDFKLAVSIEADSNTSRGTPFKVMRNGRSLGEQMASEGVVQKRDGKRRPWCRQG